MQQKSLLTIIFLLSLLGILISGYLIKVHYSQGESFCDLNEKFSCSAVNRSRYGEIGGIPIALIGLMGYGLLGLVSWGKKKEWDKKSFLGGWGGWLFSGGSLLMFSGLAFFISLGLTYTEFFVIGVVCLACLFSQVNILGISFFSYKHLRNEKREREQEKITSLINK